MHVVSARARGLCLFGGSIGCCDDVGIGKLWSDRSLAFGRGEEATRLGREACDEREGKNLIAAEQN